MRYNPDTDRALSIDEIAAQCKAAILRADAPAPAADPYAEVLTFFMDQQGILRLAQPCAA